MRIFKYAGILLGLLLALVLVIIGVLSITHDTPVKRVNAEGDKDGPPSVSDPLFARSIQLYPGTSLDPGNKVDELVTGDGTHLPQGRDLAKAQHGITVQL